MFHEKGVKAKVAPAFLRKPGLLDNVLHLLILVCLAVSIIFLSRVWRVKGDVILCWGLIPKIEFKGTPAL